MAVAENNVTSQALKHRGDVSVFRAIYGMAWRRIWSSRALLRFETVIWVLLAAYLGLIGSGLRFYFPEQWAYWTLAVFYWLAVLFTPIMIGYWVYRAHVSTGSADESLRTVALRPKQIFWPRFLAVNVSYIRLFGPWILLIVLLAETYLIPRYSDPLDRWVRIAQSQFAWMQGTQTAFYTNNLPATFAHMPWLVLAMSATMVLGWITFFGAWGFRVSVAFRGKPGTFLVPFFSGIVVPLVFYWAYRFYLFGIMFGLVPIYGDEIFLPDITVQGLAGIVISVFLFVFACRDWARRTG